MTATLAGRPVRVFVELELHHSELLKYNDENQRGCYAYFKSMLPTTNENKKAALIDSSVSILAESSTLPSLLSTLAYIYDTPAAGHPLPVSRCAIYEIAARITCSRCAPEEVVPEDIFRLMKKVAFDAQRLDVTRDIISRWRDDVRKQKTNPFQVKNDRVKHGGNQMPSQARPSFRLQEIERAVLGKPKLKAVWQRLAFIGLPFVEEGRLYFHKPLTGRH